MIMLWVVRRRRLPGSGDKNKDLRKFDGGYQSNIGSAWGESVDDE